MNIFLAILSALLTLFSYARGFTAIVILGIFVTAMAIGFEVKERRKRDSI